MVDVPALEGTWQVSDETWTISRLKGDTPEYILTQTDSEKEAVYAVHAVKLGKHYFLDMQADVSDDLYTLAFNYPMHAFYKLDLSDPASPLLYAFDSEYLEQLFEQRKIRIRHEYDPNMGIYVLTAPTAELQQFMRKYADDPKAFSDPGELVRIR